MQKYEVGQPFPGAVPATQGVTMEMGPDGDLGVLIQFPGLSREERQAFKKSFKRYYYHEAELSGVTLALWVFDFPAPMNAMEVNLNGALQHSTRPGSLEKFMEPEAGQVKNLLTFYLLDGRILRGIKTFGLHPEAVRLFHATLRKQAGQGFAEAEYARCLAGFYAGTSLDDMRKIGTRFLAKK